MSISNTHNYPMLITKAGFYASPLYNKLIPSQVNPTPSSTQKDRDRHSYIEVKQNKNYPFDKISLVVNGSKFYNRDVEVCYPAYDKNNVPKPGTVMGNFKLAPAMPAIFELHRSRAPLFFIVIKNADKPSVKNRKGNYQTANNFAGCLPGAGQKIFTYNG